VELYRVYNIAWELARKGQYEAAIVEWEKALKLGPNEANIYLNLGVALARLGKSNEAMEQYQKALEINPGAVEVLVRLGIALAEARRFDEAIARYRKVLEVRPESDSDAYDATTYNLIGEALSGKGEMAEALENLGRAIQLRAGFGPFLYDYALALVRLNRFDEAQESVEAALRADANLALAHQLRGGLLARKQQLAEAAREYRQVLELSPGFSRAHLDLATVLAAQGDMPGAVEQLREAAKGNDAAVAQTAAQALQHLGQR
jgi:tetratricopeptide (TPR) repeat protein